MAKSKIEAIQKLCDRINERIPPEKFGDARFQKLSKLIPTVASAAETMDRETLRQNVKRWREYVAEEGKKVEANFQKAAREQSGMAPDGFAAEIRARFAGLDPGAKVKAVQSFIKAHDGPGMAAVIDAPSFLTGLKAENVNFFTGQFFEATVPEMWATRAHYRDLSEHVQGVLKIAASAAEGDENA